jgi:hypothetical protein
VIYVLKKRLYSTLYVYLPKYDKQDQQGKAAFNERNPHTTHQQESVARSQGGHQTKTGQGTRQTRTGQSLK